MLDYEFVGIDDPPNDRQLETYIEKRFRNANKKADQKRSKYDDNDLAKSKGERIRKQVLAHIDLKISIGMLDFFVQEISVLGNFESWLDFVITFGDEENAKMAGAFIRYKEKELTEMEKRKFYNLANEKLLFLHSLHQKKLEKNLPLSEMIFYDDTVLSVKSSTEEEIKKIDTSVGAYVDFSQKLKRWHKEINPIFFSIKSKYEELLGIVCLYPINENGYKYIIEKSENWQIDEDDIYAAYSYKHIGFLYFHFYSLKDELENRMLLNIFRALLDARYEKKAWWFVQIVSLPQKICDRDRLIDLGFRHVIFERCPSNDDNIFGGGDDELDEMHLFDDEILGKRNWQYIWQSDASWDNQKLNPKTISFTDKWK